MTSTPRGVTPARITAILVLGWLAVVFWFDSVTFVIYNPGAKTGFEMFLALGQVFGAMVVALGNDRAGRRPWIAASMLALGLGAFTFGVLVPAVLGAPELSESVGHSLYVRSAALLLLAIGLVPHRPPGLDVRRLLAILGSGGVASLLLLAAENWLPRLVAIRPDLSTPDTDWTVPELTAFYVSLNLVPIAAGIVASWRAAEGYLGEGLEGWIVVAVVLLAGVQVHASFWPAIYSSVLTTTSLLRLGLTLVIVLGSVLSLRNLAHERAALLAVEQDRVRQLEDLGRLKRDFSSMVAHELATPVATVGNLARVIASGAASPELSATAARHIENEARAMGILVRDIQESAEIERADFSVSLRTVPVANLLDAARDHANAVAERHPVTVAAGASGEVCADPDRINQVLRNLITNAARHTPPGTPITIDASAVGDFVRFSVQDAGPGIDPADRDLILEKFGRGRAAGADGHGLGLYLSQRILEAHGTGLALESSLGHGARFSFDLERPA